MRNRVAFRFVVFWGAVLALTPLASAGVPPWLSAAASQPVPAYSSDTNAVQLLDEEIISVRDNGEISTVRHVAYKILQAKGRSVAHVSIPFDEETRISNLHAWALPAGGGREFELKDKDAIEVAISSSFYDDDRKKVFEIPAAEPGNVVGYEYEQRERPYVLQDTWWFQGSYPVVDARLTLNIPATWEAKVRFVNYGETPASPQAGTRTWELRNVPAIEDERDMPPLEAIAGRVIVDYFPSQDELKAKAHGSWQRVGQWYQGLSSDRTAASPEITEKVKELTTGAPDECTKIRKISTAAQHDIRYVAIEIGIGGFQPHYASGVYKNRYGDCKDKATLLISMLREAGMHAYYVVLNSDRGVVLPDYPAATAFNHVIVAIAAPPKPPDDVHSLYKDPALGSLLIFDPTSEITPFGELPVSEQGGYALLVAGDGGTLFQLPLLEPAVNRLERIGHLQLTASGALSGDVEEKRTGYLAAARRGELIGATPSERKKMVEDFLAEYLSGFSLKDSNVQGLEEYANPLVIDYKFEADSYVKKAGNLLLIRPRVLGLKSSGILEGKERKYPLEFAGPSEQTDRYEIALPAGLAVDELPDPVKIDCGYASYESKTEVQGNVLRYTRTYTVKKIRVPNEDLPAVKKFYRQMLADEQSSAVLKPAGMQ